MIEKYQKLIKSVVYRMAKGSTSRSEIEDVVQQVNLRLLETGLSQFDPARGSIEAYITVMARSMTIDAWRRQKYRPIPASADMDAMENGGSEDGPSCIGTNDMADDCEDALTMLIREQQREKMEQAIKSLPPDDQHFLLISMKSDYDNREYARRLGVTEVSLRVRKFRIAERLRQLLAGIQS